MWMRVLMAMVVSGAVQKLIVIALAAARPGGNIYRTIVTVCLVTAPAAWWTAPLFFDAPLGLDGRLFVLVIHLANGGLFFHFMTLPDRSVTLRILVELLLAPNQTLSIPQLSRRYSVRAMVESRIGQLCAGGFLEVGPDRAIRLLPRGRRFGRFVTAGRRLFGIESAN